MNITEVRLANGRVLEIVAHAIFPPIPDNRGDWQAFDDRTYDGSGALGVGATREAAIRDLVEQICDSDDTHELADGGAPAFERGAGGDGLPLVGSNPTPSSIDLLPTESMALTVALAQVTEGRELMPTIASVCVLALARIAGRYDYTAHLPDEERTP